ncbi:MAG: T9SS type A sorting domain-containing protein, partial [Bacteroidales bacterium]|nr:T9SS type A sorting domain-containing protein [Bacteroidales bacterium]
ELPATFDVNFNAYKSNTIDFALTQGMEDVEVTLIDIANANAETILNVNEPVTINVTAGQNEGRYQLRFSKKNVGINEVASEENTIQIWNNNSEVSINGKDLKRVEIFNTLGQRVYSSSLSGESTAFDSNLNAGAYIVKVYTANSSKSEKIIIR